MTGSYGTVTSFDPVLWDRAGDPVSAEGRLVAPAALNVAAVIQNVGKAYSFRWDEAMRDNPENALAMSRDAFYLALLQERTAKTINLEYEVKADDEDDPIQCLQRDAMNRCWRATYDLPGLKTWCLEEGTWKGRGGSQWEWGLQRDTGMRGVLFHEPVNGDSIQYAWDRTPIILISHHQYQRLKAQDPQCVVPASDRGAYGVRLYTPELRNRFCIHTHERKASDFYEGEMSGGVHGVGLRHMSYWAGWLRSETLSWMIGFMQSTGMMDLIVFYYMDGNAAGKTQAEANARKITGKMAVVCPWFREMGPFKPVEQIPMNTQGVAVLSDLIQNWIERHIERLFVGQSMSAGGGSAGGLEGDGRADFARDTKGEKQWTDADRFADTLTRDWLKPAHQFNFPGSTVPLRMAPVRDDPKAKEKVENIDKALAWGLDIEEDDARRILGVKAPRTGRKLLKPSPGPADPNAPPPPSSGSEEGDEEDDLLGSMGFSYAADQHGHDHKASGPGGGQFTSKGGGGGSAGGKPGRATGAADPKTDGPPVPPDHQEAGDHHRGLIAKVGSIPTALKEKASAYVAAKYHKFAERYGPTGAKLVMGGMVLLLPVPLPGVSLLPIALAEGVKRLGKLFKGTAAKEEAATGYDLDGSAGFDPAELARLSHQALKELCREMGEDCPRVTQEQLDHLAKVLGDHPELAGRATDQQHQYARDAKGHDHKGTGPGGGQFTSQGGGSGGKTEPEKGKGTPPAPGGAALPKAEAGRATGRVVAPKPSQPKELRAAGKYVDIARRRRVIKAVRNEGELADAIRGHNFPDSEPADVVHMLDAEGKPVTKPETIKHFLTRREMAAKIMKDKKAPAEMRADAEKLLSAPCHFYEVKTLITSKTGTVRMSAKAIKRKERWMDRYHIHFSTVVIDDRRGGKFSGHRVHVAPFSLAKTTKLEECTKADSMVAVLDHTH